MINFIEPYNPSWLIEFKNLKDYLLYQLSGLDLEIQHVGSKAIPNLPAKPILDIDIIIHDKFLLSVITKKLIKIGYEYRGEQGIKGRFAFRQTSRFTPLNKEEKVWQEHHLYICYSDSLALKNHLLFRDALMSDNNLMEQYARLKINLSKEIGMTREIYSQRKTDFIISILSKIGLDASELIKIIDANK